jgi:hypothetical protein
MKKKGKKDYRKPEVTRIALDSKTAVLGNCKMAGSGGPMGLPFDGCEPVGPCSVIGS